jgi:RNA polymerase sigma-70 factor (ECF subfamily)
MGSEPNSQNCHTLSSVDRAQLVRFAARIVGACDAEDVVQSALLKAHQRADSFRGASQLQTWVFTITRNCALDVLRLRQRQRVAESIPETLEVACAHKGTPFRLASEHRTAAHILQQLNPTHREAVLAVAAHRTVAEAAAALGIKTQTLKSRFFRAKRRMEQLVAEAA